MATNGGDVLASELMAALLTGEDVNIPTIDFSGSEYSIPGDINSDAYDVLVRLSDSDLTTGAINGTGAFDKLMVGVAAQLQGEYDAGRITGVEYTKAYIALTGSALSSSLQYLLSRDAAYWQAVQAQAASVTARVQLATAKIQNAAAKLEAMTTKANYALTKLKLATEDVQYGSLKYKLDNIDPLQVTQLTLQNSGITTSNLGLGINNDIASYNLSTTLPKQSLMLDAQLVQTTAQTAGITASNTGIGISNDIASYNLATTLPKQALLLDGQSSNLTAQTNHIVKQQLNTEAQTLQVTAQKDLLAYDLAWIKPVELTNLTTTGTNLGIQGTLLSSQKALTDNQALDVVANTSKVNYEVANILPKQYGLLTEQILQVTAQTAGTTKTNTGIDTANSIASYNLTTVLPSQVAMTNAQKLGQDKQTETANYNLINLLPKQVDLLDEQIAGAVKDTETKTYTLDELMPVQKLSLQEQAEAQRGQTMDTRSNGITPIAGSIGKQNSLYAQQVVSYQKDSQLKAAKVFSDVWITCRSIEEGFPLPKQFDHLSTDYATEKVFQAIIDENDLG